MSRYVNKSGGTLVFPGPEGRSVANGEPCDLSDEELKNSGVKVWLDRKMLVDPVAEAEAVAAEAKKAEEAAEAERKAKAEEEAAAKKKADEEAAAVAKKQQTGNG